jgi:hypothetical protein
MKRKSDPFVRTVLFGVLVAFASCHPGAVPPERAVPRWIHLVDGDNITEGGFQFYLKKGEGSTLSLYFKKRPEEPYRFLTSEIRSFADVLVGSGNRYFLINAPCSPLARCVYSADADSGLTRLISGDAVRSYEKNAPAENGDDSGKGARTILPVGEGFSPDFTQVLIRIGPNRWAYVVSASDGSILKEYGTETVPEHWWQEPGPGPGGFF